MTRHIKVIYKAHRDALEVRRLLTHYNSEAHLI